MKKLLLTTLLFSSTTTFASPFVVKDIRIDGVAADSKPAVMAQLPVKVGQTITDRDIANVVRTLYLNGSFANVQASQEGNTLVVNVTERAVISSLEFSGNDSMRSALNWLTIITLSVFIMPKCILMLIPSTVIKPM